LLVHACAGKKPSPPSPGHTRPYQINGKWYQPIPSAKGFSEKGIASWYGRKFHGRKTANGEIYNMYGMTAAHKTLPLGTHVNVRNLDNGKQVVVRVNDRGPFVRGRIIDLSYTAAKRIGIIGPGTARVKIEALGPRLASASAYRSDRPAPSIDFDRGNFSFQVGAFRNRDNAEKQKRLLSEKYRNVHISRFDSGDGVYYRVRIGKFSSLDQARRHERTLMEDGFENAFLVAD